MNEQPVTSVKEWAATSASDETISLLQDELARLEAEIRSRDEALREIDSRELASPAVDALESVESARRIGELVRELAKRDETVDFLLEQTRLFEEAAEAQRAEWDQLRDWVETVEQRVAGREVDTDALRAELESEHRRADSLQRELGQIRKQSAHEIECLEREVRHLRGLAAAHGSEKSGVESAEAMRAVSEENRRLRAACSELHRRAARAEDFDELTRRLTEAEEARAAAEKSMMCLEDERDRQRIEYDAQVASLQSRLSQQALVAGRDCRPAPLTGVPPSTLEADERIRAFRQHLKELHEREADERARMSFSSRLSRLWRSTGPSA